MYRPIPHQSRQSERPYHHPMGSQHHLRRFPRCAVAPPKASTATPSTYSPSCPPPKWPVGEMPTAMRLCNAWGRDLHELNSYIEPKRWVSSPKPPPPGWSACRSTVWWKVRTETALIASRVSGKKWWVVRD